MKSQLIKKLLRWGARIVLALIVLLALFILEEHVRGQIMLARYKADLRAKGEKLTLKELDVHERQDGNENGRELLEIEERLRQLGRECPFPIFFATYLHFVGPGRAVVRSRDPELRAGNIHLIAGAKAGQHMPGVPYRRAEWSDLATQVARARNDLTRLKAILAQGDIRLPVDLLNPSSDLIRRRPDALDWLGVEAMHALRLHDLDAVVQNVEAIAALLKVQEQLRSPRDQHKRSDAQDVGSFVTWHALQEALSDEQLMRLQQAWSTTNSTEQAVLVGDIERARQLAEYEKTVRSPRKWRWLVQSTMRGWNEPPEPWPIQDTVLYNAVMVGRGAAWCGWRWWRDELRFLQRWQAGLEANREAVKRRNLSYLMRGHTDLAAPCDELRDLLGRNLQPDFSSIETVRFETRREMALTAIAIQRFVRRAGHLPHDLSELCPQFLPELPHDWYGDLPLRYRSNDDTFTLYSVGVDGNDDGGHSGFSDDRPSFWTGKDIVWPQPVTPP
jgi:hypothetical protein